MNTDKCYFFHFGLIVTGKGEEEHLAKLFRSLTDSGCHFEVIRRIGQRAHITEKRRAKMVDIPSSIVYNRT